MQYNSRLIKHRFTEAPIPGVHAVLRVASDTNGTIMALDFSGVLVGTREPDVELSQFRIRFAVACAERASEFADGWSAADCVEDLMIQVTNPGVKKAFRSQSPN